MFSEQGLAALRGFVDHKTLFAFDLDGTLAPIKVDRQSILVSDETRKELCCLMNSAPVAIITGRSRSDARAHLEITPHFLIGNHGAEGLPGWEEQEKAYIDLCIDWEQQLIGILLRENIAGISLENKGTTLSVHFRAARSRRKARDAILRGIDLLLPRPRTVRGKCVENLLPATAPDKGTAMLYLMDVMKCPKGFYAGDDITDEDVFRLDRNRLFGVRVGTRGVSEAQYGLRSQGAVVRLLKEINQALERR